MADSSFLNWPFFSDEHRSLALQVDAWAKKQIFTTDSVNIHHSELSKRYVAQLGDAGWLRYSVVSPHGGIKEKLDVRCLCLLRDILARYSGLLEFAFAMQGLGSGPISLFGSESIKAKYLPEVAAGKIIAAFAMSEAEAGSDVASMTTTATLEGSHYILNGEKAWISNAGIAGVYVIFARTGEQPGAKGLSAFVVDADTPGLSISKQPELISPHPIGSIRLTNCKIKKEQLLGSSGSGFKVGMATLDIFRSTVGAAALGFARRALEQAISHTQSRKIFGSTLADFQLTQASIAEMATEIDASALLVYRAAWLKDSGAERITREASMAKMYATEAAQKIIDHALQLHGGEGVVSGSILETLYRDIRPLRIYEGATEIQKIVIAKEVLAKK